MKKITSIIIVLIVGFIAISCSEDFFEKPIDLDIDNHTSKLAGTAILGDSNETNQVLVSYSEGAFEDNYEEKIITNAMVNIKSNNLDVDFTFNSQSKFYAPNIPLPFVPNETYTITVEAPNYKTISATQVYPEQVPILDATINGDLLKIKINDNPNKKNYYVLKLQRRENDGNYYDQYLDPFSTSTSYSAFCYACVNFNDDTFNGEQNFEIAVNSYSGDNNSQYKVVLYNVTEDYYRYDVSLLQSEDSEGNPFVEPIILHRNFENGYGVFALVNKSEFILTN